MRPTSKGSVFAAGAGGAAAACGLRPLAPGESGSAGTASAAVALSLVEATIEERARVATAMGRALADSVYEAPAVPDAMPATDPARLDAGLYLLRPLGTGTYGSVCAAGLRQPPPGLAAATSTGAAGQRATESPPPQLPLAIKVTAVSAYDSPDVAVREVVLTRMLSALVRTRACPNLPCVYGAAAQYPVPADAAAGAGTGSVDLFQEVADCDLAAWAAGPRRSEAEWMSVAFQVCAGLAWAARVYDLVNNDLYGRNMLLSRILAPSDASADVRLGRAGPACARGDLACGVDPIFRYALQSRAHGWRRFAVRTRCWLARPTDFGLASSDRLRALGVDVTGHDDVARAYGLVGDVQGAALQAPTPASIAMLMGAPGAAVHVLFHPYLNAYARDLATLLATMASQTGAPVGVRRWAVAGLHALYARVLSGEPARRPSALFTRAITAAAQRHRGAGAAAAATAFMAPVRNRAFRQPDDLIDFVTGVLFDDALLREAGLPRDLFADDASTAAAAGTQFFVLPILDTPPPIEVPTAGAPAPEPVDVLARAFGVPL